MAGALGIEPKLTESKSVVLPLHNAPTMLVPSTRIELVSIGYQPIALAIELRRNNLVDAVGVEPTQN